MLTNYSITNLTLELLLDDCRTLLKKFHELIIQHIFREANQCANTLAKFRVFLSFDYVYFVNPPTMMEDLLAFDKPEFFIIDLFVINLYQHRFAQKKKNVMSTYTFHSSHTYTSHTLQGKCYVHIYTKRNSFTHVYIVLHFLKRNIMFTIFLQYFHHKF